MYRPGQWSYRSTLHRSSSALISLIIVLFEAPRRKHAPVSAETCLLHSAHPLEAAESFRSRLISLESEMVRKTFISATPYQSPRRCSISIQSKAIRFADPNIIPFNVWKHETIFTYSNEGLENIMKNMLN